MKTCRICNVTKDVNEFSKRKDTKDGFKHECKECARNIRREYYSRNREREIQRNMIYQYANKENNKARSIHRMAQLLRLKVMLRDQLHCKSCEKAVDFDVRDSPNKAYVDHIIPRPHGGRTEMDNLQTLCRGCYRKKQAILIATIKL